MLFNIVVYVLEKMLERLNGSLTSRISNKLDKAVYAQQYADDTVHVAAIDAPTMVSLKIVLRLFSAVSGLLINYDKSTWVPINVRPQRVPIVSAVMGYTISDFPITYLGLPLTIKKPHRALYLPLIHKIETQLEGWKSKLLSRGGRFELMNSVLSFIPIYFMASFLIPQWVISRLDQIRRGFLWGKTDSHRGISLINWETVCFPKQNHGMGGVDLKLRNHSLLIRWWWR